MITDPSNDAKAEYADDLLEVQVVIRVAQMGDVSVGRILDNMHNALAGALTALGIPGVEAVLATWHETRAVEARESEDF